MPLYEYQCKSCGKDFEKMVRFSELENLPECPHCHSLETNKRISIAARAGFGLNLSGGTGTSCAPSSSGFS